MRLHNKGEKNPNYGKPKSAETRQKISEAQKGHEGYWKGKHLSTEARQKLSEAYKGRHWRLENGRRVWTE